MIRRACAILPWLWLAGCAGIHQSAVDPAGTQAGKIAGLFWFFLGLLGAIFVIVMAFALWTLTRRHRGIEQEPLEHAHSPSTATEARLSRGVMAATVVTIFILFGLL